MAELFPDHPNLVDGYAPLQMECDADDLVMVPIPNLLHSAIITGLVAME